MSHRKVQFSIGLFGALMLSGCDKSSTSESVPQMRTAKSLDAPVLPSSDPNSAAPVDPSKTTERNFDGAIFQVPGGWIEQPKKSEYIKAEFDVPGPGGAGRLTLSTAGGTVEENITRWKGMFFRGADDPSPKESSLSVAGKEAKLVELFGSYQGMEPGATRKSGQAMLGAVIPLRETNYFVKLTGPRETLAEVREAFVKFVETAKFKE